MHDDLGEPISYLMLAPGVPVHSADGQRVGTVAHVLAAPRQDIFDGLVIGGLRHGHGHRFVEAAAVASLHEHGVVLTLSDDACRALPEPAPGAGADASGGGVLQRAWDLLSGRG